MNWILFALLGPLLFAITSFIDKYLVSRYFHSSAKALVVYTGLMGLPAFVLILIFTPKVIASINFSTGILILINSFLVIGYLFPYYAAIKRADISSIIPLFQMIPIFNFILGFFILHETLTLVQTLAFILILVGSFLLSFNFKKGIKFEKKVFFLMLLAILMISLNAVVFKYFAVNTDFWTTSFWQYLGFTIFGFILLLFNGIRKDFIESFTKNKSKIISLNALNEIINLLAIIVFTYAAIHAPIAIISAVNGMGPVFVFIIGVLLTIFIPKIIKEDLSRRTIIQKILAIIIIFVGGFILNNSYGAGY